MGLQDQSRPSVQFKTNHPFNPQYNFLTTLSEFLTISTTVQNNQTQTIINLLNLN